MILHYRKNGNGSISYGTIERKGSKQWFKNNPDASQMLPKSWRKEVYFLKHHPMNIDQEVHGSVATTDAMKTESWLPNKKSKHL